MLSSSQCGHFGGPGVRAGALRSREDGVGVNGEISWRVRFSLGDAAVFISGPGISFTSMYNHTHSQER